MLVFTLDLQIHQTAWYKIWRKVDINFFSRQWKSKCFHGFMERRLQPQHSYYKKNAINIGLYLKPIFL